MTRIQPRGSAASGADSFSRMRLQRRGGAPPLSELEASPRSASDCSTADERASARRMRRRRRRCCAAIVSTMAADMSLGVRSASPNSAASHCAMLDRGVVLSRADTRQSRSLKRRLQGRGAAANRLCRRVAACKAAGHLVQQAPACSPVLSKAAGREARTGPPPGAQRTCSSQTASSRT